MARLIPTTPDSSSPPGERDVFQMLAHGPIDWVAVHSLDLAPWNRGLRTEIDFLVIVPDTGILCIEVKSHDTIGFDGSAWFPASIKRSPFKQASDARYTFRNRLRELAPELERVPILHCCIFPRAVFSLGSNISILPHELVDATAFRACADGPALCNLLRDKMRQAIAADGGITPLPQALHPAQVERFVKYCVPIQLRRPEARQEIEQRALEAERVLREQQKPVLQLCRLNERVVVTGGAGTGKTLVAMQVARRAAEQGHRVALLCFNHLVSDWLQRQLARMSPPLPNLVAGRAVHVMAEMTGIALPASPAQEFWDTELPLLLEERLTDPDLKDMASFDYLVLDEAQDLLARPRMWQCLEQFLTGGVADGRFALFGDFDHQVLANRALMKENLTELHREAHPARWQLHENCRNYRIIGDTAVRLGGVAQDVYTGYLRAGGSLRDYDVHFYDHDQAQQDKLGAWLREFKVQGYKPEEIALVSFKKDANSAAYRLKMAGHKLRPALNAIDGTTGYCSVHAFKGMENKVVIVTDITIGEQDFYRDLLYISLTRATESVRLLCASESRELVEKWLGQA